MDNFTITAQIGNRVNGNLLELTLNISNLGQELRNTQLILAHYYVVKTGFKKIREQLLQRIGVNLLAVLKDNSWNLWKLRLENLDKRQVKRVASYKRSVETNSINIARHARNYLFIQQPLHEAVLVMPADLVRPLAKSVNNRNIMPRP